MAKADHPREKLKHVYWLGGAPGAGKSTIARRLASQYGLQIYATDDVMSAHAARSRPEDSPFLAKFMSMDMDERWLNRSPETMLETFHWFRGEGFSFIVEDLLALPEQPGVIAEGFRLLPEFVQPLLTVATKAVWLLPTPEFYRMANESRGSVWAIAGKTSNPEKARDNLAERNRMFTDRLRDNVKHVGLNMVSLDISMTEEQTFADVTRAFRL